MMKKVFNFDICSQSLNLSSFIADSTTIKARVFGLVLFEYFQVRQEPTCKLSDQAKNVPRSNPLAYFTRLSVSICNIGKNYLSFDDGKIFADVA